MAITTKLLDDSKHKIIPQSTRDNVSLEDRTRRSEWPEAVSK